MSPIIFRLSHYRKTIAISTGFAVPPEYWNDKNREVKKTYNGVSSVARLNNLLAKKNKYFHLFFSKLRIRELLFT